DLPADREPEPGALAGGLRGDKGLEQLVPDVRRDADAVVAHPYFDRVAEIARRHLQHRAKVRSGAVTLPPGGRIKAVAEHIQKHSGHLLRRQRHRTETAVKLALQSDVEARILGARTVIGEVERLLDHRVEINHPALARNPAGVFEHALDDTVGALAV